MIRRSSRRRGVVAVGIVSALVATFAAGGTSTAGAQGSVRGFDGSTITVEAAMS